MNMYAVVPGGHVAEMDRNGCLTVGLDDRSKQTQLGRVRDLLLKTLILKFPIDDFSILSATPLRGPLNILIGLAEKEIEIMQLEFKYSISVLSLNSIFQLLSKSLQRYKCDSRKKISTKVNKAIENWKKMVNNRNNIAVLQLHQQYI